jgi:hypothetical protein
MADINIFRDESIESGSFLDPFLEQEELIAVQEEEDREIRRRETELRRFEAEAGDERPAPPPGASAEARATQPREEPVPTALEEDDGSPGFFSEAFNATIGGVLGEIRDIVVNIDTLTDAALTGLGILEEDEKQGIFGLQELLPDIAEPESGAGKIVRGLVEFGTGFLLFGAAGRAAGITSKLLINSIASGAEAGFGRGQDEGRLADLVSELAPSLEDDRIIGGLIQFLKSSEDEGALEGFAKNVVEDVLLGFGFEGATFVASRVAQSLRPGVVRSVLGEELGAAGAGGRFGPRPAAAPGEEVAQEAVVPLAASGDEALDNLVRDADDIGASVTREVEGSLATDEPLLSSPAAGEYDAAHVASVAGTADQTRPEFKAVANYTVRKSRDLGAAASKALEGGLKPGDREEVYKKLLAFSDGYDKIGRAVRERGDVLRATTAFDPTRSSSYARQLGELINSGEAGIDEQTLFKGIVEKPAALAQSLAHGQKTFGQLTGDVLTELFYSSALSSPSTLIRAAMGAPVLFAYQTAEKLVGGVLTGNRSGLLGEAFHDMQGAFRGFLDGVNVMGKSLLSEGAGNVNSAAIFRGTQIQNEAAITGANFGASGLLGQAIDVTGKAIRFPTRTLGAVDKGTKVTMSRVLLHRKAYRKAREAVLQSGASGRAAQEMHTRIYNDMLSTGLDDGLQREIDAETARLTLSADLQPGFLKNLNDLANSNNFTRVMFPFVRVSTNAITTSLEKTPILGLFQKRTKEILATGDPNAIAQLAGSQALGTAIAGTAAFLTMNGFMTGAAPQNPSLRAAWDLSGRREYSFNIPTPSGDTVSIQYNRIGEPFGFLLGAMADLTWGFSHIDEKLAEIDNPEERSVFSESIAVVISATANNLTKKTFMQSMLDFSRAVTEPDRFLSQFAAGRITGHIPLGGLLNSINRELNPEMPEVATFMDRVYSRVPFFNGNLPPKRNLFGEPIEFAPGFGAAFVNPELVFGIPAGAADMFSPVIANTIDEQDPAVVIGRAITQNNLAPRGVRTPRSFRGIELMPEERDFVAQRRGQIRIDGDDLKTALFKLVTRESIFQDALPGRDGAKEALMSRIIGMYNQAAIAEMLDNFDFFDRIEDRLERLGRL